jgi:hypothetical protein
MKLPFFKKRTLPKKVGELLSPSEAFKQKTKGRFLATFDAHNPMARNTGSQLVFGMKVFAATVAILVVVLGSASAYADTANVAADSPLYPLKRLSESVQLAVATPATKSQLEATFAARRATEITDLESRNPTSTLIGKLSTDLTTEVGASISGTEHERGQSGVSSANASGTTTSSLGVAATTSLEVRLQNTKDVCTTLQSLFGTSSSLVEKALADHPNLLQRFETQCATSTDTMGDGVPVPLVPASIIESVTSTTSMTTPVTPIPTTPTNTRVRLEERAEIVHSLGL